MTRNYERIAIVTGATSGIGEATSNTLVDEGYGVVGNGRTANKLELMEKELAASFFGVAGDASQEAVIDLHKTLTPSPFCTGV